MASRTLRLMLRSVAALKPSDDTNNDFANCWVMVDAPRNFFV